ncbi:MAG: DUF2993 domain-containing protein [Leptolyngbyaceae cyanobacterium bins.349]|nr:DUF2993 domain-containing protein [Leptolyngbyaceae cyanobacterium bins.349]
MPLDDARVPEQQLEAEAIEPAQLAPEAGAPAQHQSRLISRVLAPAVKLWVRSQLEHVEDLHLMIEAGDRQLLSGGIDCVSASASKAVYQGLHFSQIRVNGRQIQTNLGQMLRGKPFRLLAAFPVMGEVSLSEADLNASLTAPLLATAVAEFLLTLLQQDTNASSPPSQTQLRQVQVQLGENELTFTGVLVTPDAERAIAIRTGITIKKGNLLKLEGFQHCNAVDELVSTRTASSNFTIPLGSDVYLEELAIREKHLVCQGRILVTPGP